MNEKAGWQCFFVSSNASISHRQQDTAEVVKKFVERNPTEMNFALVALSRAE